MPSKARDEAAVLSVAELRQHVAYEPETGGFTRLALPGDDRGTKSRNARFAGKPTGSLNKANGYCDIPITVNGNYILFRAHRVAWALMTGAWPHRDVQIDHRNNVRHDNRWTNLRTGSHSDNGKGKQHSRANSSGFKGVTYRSRCTQNPWRAQILVDGKKMCLGHHPSATKAALAYDAAALKHHGAFARTNLFLGLL